MSEHYPGLKEKPVPGTTVELSGFSFQVPPLLLRDARQAFADGIFDSLFKDGALTPERMDAANWVLLKSIQRNYPNFSQHDLDEVLDVGNIAEIVKAVMGVNRLEARPTMAAPAATGTGLTTGPENSGRTLN